MFSMVVRISATVAVWNMAESRQKSSLSGLCRCGELCNCEMNVRAQMFSRSNPKI